MKIKIIQTADANSIYKRIFDVTSVINKHYCDRHGYDYGSYIGVIHGCHSWHAAFNRIYMIQQEASKDAAIRADWLVYMDTDAIVEDFDVKIEDIVTSDDTNATKCMLFCTGSDTEHLHDINDGVILVNLQHPALVHVTNMWRAMYESIMTPDILAKSSLPWSVSAGKMILDDQCFMSMIINVYKAFHKANDLFRVYRGAEKNKFNYAGFIKQILRATGDNETRLEIVQREAERIRQRYDLSDYDKKQPSIFTKKETLLL